MRVERSEVLGTEVKIRRHELKRIIVMLAWWFILANGLHHDYLHQFGPFNDKGICQAIASWVVMVDDHHHDHQNAPQASACWES